VLDLRCAGGGEAGSVVVGGGGCEGERFVSRRGGGAVCGGEERDCGFERDACEGREGDTQRAEDVGDWEGEGVVAVEGVGGEGGEEEEVLGWC